MAWRVAGCLPVLRGQVNDRFPNRDKASDGTIGDAAHAATKSDHNPDQFGVVRAQDFDDDTRDPVVPSLGKWLGERMQAGRDSRLSYIIRYEQIMYGEEAARRNGLQPWIWYRYYGTDKHDTHCHLSVVSTVAADITHPWDLTLPGQSPPEDTLSAAEVAEIKAFIAERSIEDRQWFQDHLAAKLGGTINRIVAIHANVASSGRLTAEALNALPGLIAAQINVQPAGAEIDVEAVATAVLDGLSERLGDPQ